MGALGAVVVGADLDAEGHAEPLDHQRRLAARAVVAGFPEALFLGDVELGVAGKKVARRVVDQRLVAALAACRVDDDRSAEHRDAGGLGGLRQQTVARAVLGLGVVGALVTGRRRPGG
jgi:hypothetical protein